MNKAGILLKILNKIILQSGKLKIPSVAKAFHTKTCHYLMPGSMKSYSVRGLLISCQIALIVLVENLPKRLEAGHLASSAKIQ